MKKITLFSLLLALFSFSFISAQTIEIVGAKDTHSSTFPQPSAQQYSYTQCIYLNTEVSAGMIYGIQYEFNSGNLNNSQNWEIWAGETAQADFSQATGVYYTDFVRPLTKVFDGTVAVNGTKVTIYFDTPINYSATNNLVIAVNEKTPGQGGPSWWLGATSGNKCMYAVSNNSLFSGTGTFGGGGHGGAWRPYTGFIQTPKCEAPTNVVVTNPTATTAEVSFDALNSTSWTMSYFPQGGGTINEATSTNTGNIITGLTPYKQYTISVAGDCGQSGPSLSSASTVFRTDKCDDPGTLSITESFDGNLNSLLQNCWTTLDKNNYGTLTTNVTTTANTGTHSVGFSVYNSNQVYLITPKIANINNGILKFWIKSGSYSVGTMSNNYSVGAYTEFTTVSATLSNTWEEVEVDFSSYYGEDQYIAIRVASANQYVDDINFEGTALPTKFLQDFENFGAGPFQNIEGWKVYNDYSGNSNYGVEINHTLSYPSGNRDLYLGEAQDFARYLISPKMGDINGKLLFYAKNLSGNQLIEFGTIPSQDFTDKTNITTIASVQANSTEWTKITVDLSTYTGTDKYFVWKFPVDAASPSLLLDYIGYNEADTVISKLICDGDSYLFGGIGRTIAGTYYDSIPRAGLTDSITQLNLSVQSDVRSILHATECSAYTSPSGNYTWQETGNYYDTLSTIYGCDSVLEINLTITSPLKSISITALEICDGDSTTISLTSPEADVEYSLVNPHSMQVIDGPVSGNGPIEFNTGALSGSNDFTIKAFKDLNSVDSSSLKFTGAYQYLLVDNPTGITLGDEFSFELWVLPSSVNYDRLISNYSGSGNVLNGNLIIDTYSPSNTGLDLRWIMTTNNIQYTLNPTNVLVRNEWNHTAFVFKNGVATIYVNGIQVAQSTAGFTSFLNIDNKWGIGEDYTPGTSEYFTGRLDEVRFWNTARTEAQIQNNMKKCLTGYETGLALYYDFENTLADQGVKDVSPNGNDATVKNITINTASVLDGAFPCHSGICESIVTDTFEITTVTVDKNIAINLNSELEVLVGADAYQWLYCPAYSAVLNENNNTYHPSTDGTYAVEITKGGCIDTSACTTYSTVGISEQSKLDVSIWPVPAENEVNIRTSLEIISATIYNSLGEKLIQTNTTHVDISTLNCGIYFMEVITPQGIHKQRILKK